MGDRLRVGLLSREYPPETGWGGIGTYTYNLACGLTRAGHEVHVVAASHDDREHCYEADGITIQRLPLRYATRLPSGRVIWRVKKRLQHLANMLEHSHRAAKCLQEIRRREGLDIIEFPDYWGEGFVITRARRRLAPTVGRVHGYHKLMLRLHQRSVTREMRWQHRIEQMALRDADLVSPNSHWIADQLEDDYGIPAASQRIQFMGIDTDRFSLARIKGAGRELRRSLELPEEAAVILSCGRIERRKGYEHLIRALGTLKSRGVEAYLVVAGRDTPDGAESARLRGIAEECGVAAALRLPGQVPYSDLPAWYAMCSIYAGASRGESPGLTYVEAMACRRPVVAFADGAIPEVVRHGETGLLVDPDDPAALADALERLVRDAALREQMGALGEQHAVDCFSLKVTIARHAEMYRDVITTRCAGTRQEN